MNIIRVSQYVVFPIYKLFGLLAIRNTSRARLEDNGKPVLVIANHISYLDPFVIVAHFKFIEAKRLIPLRTIMNNNLLYRTPFAPLLLLLGCFPVRPRKGRLHGLAAARDYAKENSLFFFPEGGRVGSKHASRLRTGAAVVANELEIGVVPVYISRARLGFSVVRGKEFKASGMTIEDMMDRVYQLKERI